MRNPEKNNEVSLRKAVVVAALLAMLLFASVVIGQSPESGDCKKDEKGVAKDAGVKKDDKAKTVYYTKDSGGGRYRSYIAGYGRKPVYSEKAIRVRPKVYVSMCVRQGKIKVNGWARNEVRAFLGGSKALGFKVRERSGKEKLPVWLEVLGYDPSKKEAYGSDKCLSGDDIELDMPVGASIRLKGISSETTIETIKSAEIEIVGGDIYLNNISRNINATTRRGGVTVNNSKGRISVATTTGNIVAYHTEPIEIGDYFKAKTHSGAVTMQSINQKTVAASSISGSINYFGRIRDYGQYNFNTTNGLINLMLPPDSSFWLKAVFGGEFISDFRFEVITENETESAVILNARLGTKEANVVLQSYNGTIRIRKRGKPVAFAPRMRLPRRAAARDRGPRFKRIFF